MLTTIHTYKLIIRYTNCPTKLRTSSLDTPTALQTYESIATCQLSYDLEDIESEAPQWLKEAFEAQARQIADLAAQQANAMANLANRIDQVEEECITETIRVLAFTPASTSTPKPSSTTVRPKPYLPNPDKFDGKDLALFPQFEGLL